MRAFNVGQTREEMIGDLNYWGNRSNPLPFTIMSYLGGSLANIQLKLGSLPKNIVRSTIEEYIAEADARSRALRQMHSHLPPLFCSTSG